MAKRKKKNNKKPVKKKTIPPKSKKKKKKRLNGIERYIYSQLDELYNKKPKKRKITKKAAGIFRELNRLYRESPKKPGGFAKSNKFNHIRVLLWLNHKVDFKAYSDPEFIGYVKQIYNDLKRPHAVGTDEAILARYLELKKDFKREQPFLDPDLLNIKPYFDINTIEFISFEPYLWIVSPMIIPAPGEFIVTDYYYNYAKRLNPPDSDLFDFIKQIRKDVGETFRHLSKKETTYVKELTGRKISTWSSIDKTKFVEIYSKWNGDLNRGYYKYFREWVDWCNQLMSDLHGIGGGYDINFKFLPVEYNEDKKRWETTIVICDANEVVDDFGFTPKGNIKDHDVANEYKPIDPAKVNLPPTEKKKEQQIEVEKRKQTQTLQNALTDLLEKLKKRQKKEKHEDLINALLEQDIKEKELVRLSKIEKKIRKDIALYMKLKRKKELTQALKELDKIMKKILKLS